MSMSFFACRALAEPQPNERATLDLMPILELTRFDVVRDIAGQSGSHLHLVCDGVVRSSRSKGWVAPLAIDMHGPSNFVGDTELFGGQGDATQGTVTELFGVVRERVAP